MRNSFGWSVLLPAFVLVFALVSPQALAQDTAYLLKAGASNYRIVLESSASPSERHAAGELQSHFNACTGVELPIVTGRPADSAPMIVLGCGPTAQRLGVAPAPAELGEQGYVIRTVHPHVVIAGTAVAGTLYGVYDFLEKCLGVRWYAPGVTKTPRIAELPLPEVDRLVQPAFLCRDTSYARPGSDADFIARQRENAGGGGPDNPHGIQHAHDGRAHSYFRYVSPGEFFDTHPEYFSEIGGVRRRDETQLCLTNPDVLEIVTAGMLKRMGANPNARQYNFSQMDYYNHCQCASCTKVNQKYGTLGGTQFWFVNQLAERTSKVYPDKVIGTLAYTYTEEPPKDLVMHPNVAVWLCHMYPSCDSHAIATCRLNADYKRRAIAWSKICSHLYIWHYIVDFAHYYNPFPNFGAMGEDMRFYRDIGVEGIYLQGMGHGGGGGEFSLLRPYYGMRLLWDPGQDADAILRDFLGGYYGPAAEPIMSYIKLLQAKVDTDDIHMHLYTNPAQGYLTDEILAQAGVLFDQAEAAVRDDEGLLERVRVARMPLTYARFFPRNGYTIEDGTLRFTGPFAAPAEIAEMASRMRAHGFNTLREIGEFHGDPDQFPMLAMALSSPMACPRIENQYLAVDVLPFLGGRALRITDKRSGECVTAHNTTRNILFPFCGGEETRTGGTFRWRGSFDQYAVEEKTDTTISLVTGGAGLPLRRTLTLAPDAPILTIAAQVTNAGEKPSEVTVRNHVELDLGELTGTRVRFTDRTGQDIQKDMQPIIEGLRQGEHYLDQKAPKNSWTFTGGKGIEVTQTFDDGQLDFAWLYAYPDYLNELEAELWAKPVTLGAGESTTFTATLEVRPVTK
ncbi:MAG: DUF4838 domain-containing protein [Armatimonadota bacterium]|nr:MAG: DUF4838 domain-containing protein [Armatimonadota bacterium]